MIMMSSFKQDHKGFDTFKQTAKLLHSYNVLSSLGNIQPSSHLKMHIALPLQLHLVHYPVLILSPTCGKICCQGVYKSPYKSLLRKLHSLGTLPPVRIEPGNSGSTDRCFNHCTTVHSWVNVAS